MEHNNEIHTIDRGFTAPNDNNNSDELPKVKVALILGIISIVAAGGGIPGIVLSIISKNMAKPGLALYESNPEKYEKDKKTLFGAMKCAKIGMIIAIPMTAIVVLLNAFNISNMF